jgi:hypothetical protein
MHREPRAGKDFLESLTSGPELENNLRHKPKSFRMEQVTSYLAQTFASPVGTKDAIPLLESSSKRWVWIAPLPSSNGISG